MLNVITSWFIQNGIQQSVAQVLGTSVAVVVTAVLAYTAHVIMRKLLMRLITKLIITTDTQWDDALLKHHFFDRVAQIAPAAVLYILIPDTFGYVETIAGIAGKGAILYMLFVAVLAVDSLLNAVQEVYRTFKVSKSVSITVFLQLIKIVTYFISILVGISILIDKSPAGLLTGLGAMSAVTMLVFKDAILGFVAGIQLSANRMVAVGDWIEVPSLGVDGDVVKVGLATVVIKNFDKTTTTLPTHKLITGAFKNWRGMQESGGRRIKRSISIDMTSVKFCSPEMIERFSKISLIQNYLKDRQTTIQEHNTNTNADKDTLINGRHMTNLGTFRAYIKAYLNNHSEISKSLTFLVRQLPPSESGIPIQIYVFSTDTAWVNYEGIQSDIFDHLLAVVPEFDLKVFQSPTGNDIQIGLAGKGQDN